MFSTPAVSVQGVEPFSKPPLTINCFAVPPVALTVSEIVVVCESDPEVPVMVTVAVPVVAVELAANVTVLDPVVGLVPNEAVTPEGSPEAESDTDPVNPPESETVTVLLALLPCVTETLAGEAESEKFGVATAVTVSEIEVEWLSEPEVPVIVTVEVPVVAVALALKLTVLDPVVGLVPNVAVTPEGRPEAESDTDPVNPPEGVIVTVLLPLPPCATETLVGDAAMEKFAAAAAGGRMQLLALFENSSWTV